MFVAWNRNGKGNTILKTLMDDPPIINNKTKNKNNNGAVTLGWNDNGNIILHDTLMDGFTTTPLFVDESLSQVIQEQPLVETIEETDDINNILMVHPLEQLTLAP